MGRLPNWFILGAGRCGTTTLWHALNQHPQIFLSPVKEPTFFCDPFQVVGNPIGYADLFAGAAEAVAVGEASHAYLTHPDAARAIEAFFPDARFVLIFRNPADRAFSLYHCLHSAGFEPMPTFERALAAEDRRYASDRFARDCPQYLWNYLYFRSGRFGEQVARYFDLFPRKHFLVTTLYQLVADPDRVIGEIHDFLGVERQAVGVVPRLNASYGIRSRAIDVLSRKYQLPPLVERRMPGIGRVQGRLRAWNVRGMPELRPKTRATLLERYREDLDLLRDLTGVDVLAEEAAHASTLARQAAPSS